jgi:FkbM family methyltransferase
MARMARFARIIISDFFGLIRVCGFGVAFKWIMMILLNLRQCIRQRNLQVPDRAMGKGPYHLRLRNHRAIIEDPWAMSSIREIWVRDSYLNGGYLTIPPGAMVLDLGANRGIFTALALGAHPDVRCICVEPRLSDDERIRHLLKVNGWEDRAQICSGFIGGETQIQRDMVASEEGLQQEYFTEEQFIARYQLTKIDFIKCDIEGSEYELFKPGSRLLAIAQQMAMEVHGDAAKRNTLIELIRNEGFEVIMQKEDPGDCIINARRKAQPGRASSATATAQAAHAAAAAPAPAAHA